jgi:threonine aldolase
VARIPGVRVLQPRQANALFVSLPERAAAALRGEGWRFYDFIGAGGARLMCAWDTTPEDVRAFAAALAAAAAGDGGPAAPAAGAR